MKLSEEELNEKILFGVYLEQAIDNVGIYPKSISGKGKGTYKKRTPYMEGHNDCAMSINKYCIKLSDYVTNHKYKKDIEFALIHELVDMRTNGDNVYLYINCNDVFDWACSESEEIKPEELKDLFKCYEESKEYGGMLWASRKRKQKPQQPWFDRYFNDKEKELFNNVEGI